MPQKNLVLAVDDRSFGGRLHQLRCACGLTLEALARACGCTKAYVWQLERNGASPSAAVLMGLCRVLGVRAQDLMEPWADEDQPVRPGAQDIIFLNRYLRLDTSQRRHCQDLLRTMLCGPSSPPVV